MDRKGSLVDTSLRIYPTEKLKTFLENKALGHNVPVNIGRLVKGETYKPKENVSNNPKPIDVHLSKKEIKKLNRIKNKLKEQDVSSSEHESEELITNGNTDADQTSKKKNAEKAAFKLPETEDVTEEEENSKEEDDKPQGPYLTTLDIDWLYIYIKEQKSKGVDIPYLHELLEGSYIELPENEILKRNPSLEARCVKLRAQQEAREYRKMTKGVDNVRMKFPEDSISYQLKQMNRQLIAIGQFIISIFAGFLFGFRGVEWMVGNLDFGFRLLLGVMCALIIALAEIYFLAKKLNEELSVPETTQLGGPPKFVDEKYNIDHRSKPIVKPHQD